ncbi:hypothetical protein [Halohasta litorea]|uniref:Uncharacterized protein n=1 Tax=Halohasta litorea TaxID=869891 RepID=A0ABD6DD54_9EURY|nr:hypothetical protein [Halohasta litorea]
MDRIRYPVLISQGVAVCLLCGAIVAILMVELPMSPELRIGIRSAPGVLTLSVWARVIGRHREPTDIVLALFSVPCVIVSVWAISEALTASSGVIFGGLLSVASGVLLSVAVLADAAVEQVVDYHTE